MPLVKEPKFPALIGRPQEPQEEAKEPRPRKLRPLGAKRPSGVNRRAFQATRDQDVSSVYDWEQRKELGSGSFGAVFLVKHRLNPKKQVAIKQVAKEHCQQLEQLRTEIKVLSSLDHPRVLHFFEAFEDFKHIYIVTELCTGGDLQQCLVPMRGDVSFARHCADQILRALAYCHSRGVCHRDLKPENVLLVRKLHGADTPLRLADFGLARKFKVPRKQLCDQISHMKSRCSEASMHHMRSRCSDASAMNHVKSRFSEGSMNEVTPMNSFVGTAEYMAPEVMSVLYAEMTDGAAPKSYDFRCDVWSLGVIIHCLLRGEPLYSLEELVAHVEEQKELPAVDASLAQGFLKRCLVVPYKNRPSARLLAAEPFLKDTSTFARIDKDGSGTVNLSQLRDYLGESQKVEKVDQLFKTLDQDKDGIITEAEFQKGFEAFRSALAGDVASELVQRVEQFTRSSQLKKAVLTSAARHLGGYELQKLRETFESVDLNGDGIISKKEWDRSFALAGESAEWALEAFLALDTDGSGEIDYREFLAALMDAKVLERRDLLWAAFQDFDQSNAGSISKENLLKVLQGEVVRGVLEMEDKETSVDSLLAKVKADDCGELSFDGFIELLQVS